MQLGMNSKSQTPSAKQGQVCPGNKYFCKGEAKVNRKTWDQLGFSRCSPSVGIHSLAPGAHGTSGTGTGVPRACISLFLVLEALEHHTQGSHLL